MNHIMTEYFEINSDRYPISCKIIKSAEGCVEKTILGIHGFCGSKESFMLTKIGEAAAGRNAALICFDLPAHGQSAASDDQLTIENCLKDIEIISEWICQTYPDADRNLFATSFGGFLALQCLDRFYDHKMILRAPAVTMPEHILLDLIDDDLETYRRRGRTETGFERKIKLPYAFYEEIQHYTVMNRNYDHPALILHGDLDEVVPRADISHFCQNNLNFVLKTIPNTEHRILDPAIQHHVVDLAMDWFEIL